MIDAEQHGIPFVCHECDALQTVPEIKPGNVATCYCCGSTLFRNLAGGVQKPLALIISSMILFLVANIYPIMTINIAGIERAATLTDSALIFLKLGHPELAATVWLPGVFIPGFVIIGLLYVLLSVHFNLRWPYTRPALSWASRLMPWGMMDVFLLGILVCLVKLATLADVLLGTAFYAFVVLIFVYAAASSTLDPHILWECLDKQRSKPKVT